jgi:V-type H+-transporting ATPase subunit a
MFPELQSPQLSVRFNQLVGVIKKEDEVRFKRIVFRVTKGNIWINMVDIDQSMLLGNEQIVDPKDVHVDY